MKVAIVTRPPSASAGMGDDPAGEHGTRLAAELAASGHDVTVYARDEGQRDSERDGDADGRATSTYDVKWLSAGPAAPMPPGDALPFLGDFARQLNCAWTTDPPDVIHAHSWRLGLAAQLAADLDHLPTVQSFHGVTAARHRPAGNGRSAPTSQARLEALLAKAGTWVIAGSSEEQAALARMRGTRARLSVVGDAVDVDRFTLAPAKFERRSRKGGGGHRAPHNAPKQAASRANGQAAGRFRIVGLASTFAADSGFDVVVRALTALPGVDFVAAVTAGQGGNPHELRRLARIAGVQDRVHFTAARTPDELAALLKSADIATCTPVSAVNAKQLLPAMACAVPVVVTAVGALADAVVHDVTGLLVPPNSSGQIATALKGLLGESFRRQSLGAAGRARVGARYSWQRVALETHEIYERAVEVAPATERRNRRPSVRSTPVTAPMHASGRLN